MTELETPVPATPAKGSTMASSASDHRVEALLDALERAGGRPDRSARLARLGAVLMAVGLGATILAVVLSQLTNNPLDQSTDISLGIAGLAAIAVGAVVHVCNSFGLLMRFWMLRLVHELDGRDEPAQDAHG